MPDFSGVLDSDVPLVYQIYSQFRREIIDGIWVNRDDFPGEVEVSAQYKVSPITARRALERLAREGYLRRQRGRRPAAMEVTEELLPHRPAPTIFPVDRSPFGYTVLSNGVDAVPREACQAFGVPAGTPLWTCYRLRTFEGRAHSVSYNVQTVELGSKHLLRDLKLRSMPEILNKVGKNIEKISRRISVTLPSPQIAGYMALSLQQPMLLYTYSSFDRAEQIIEWLRVYLHPDECAPTEKMNLAEHSWESLGIL